MNVTCTVSYGNAKLPAKRLLESQLLVRKFTLETVHPVMGSQKQFFTRLVEGGEACFYFLLTNGEKETDPFNLHREPGRRV